MSVVQHTKSWIHCEHVGDLAHGLLYVEIIDHPGTDHDRMLVRSYVTRDNWETAQWDRLWEKPIESPDRDPVDRPTMP